MESFIEEHKTNLIYAGVALAIAAIIYFIYYCSTEGLDVAPMATQASSIYGVIPRATIFDPIIRTQ